MNSIAIISPVFHPIIGGQPTAVKEIGRRLHKKGYSIYIITKQIKNHKKHETIQGMVTYRAPYISRPFIETASFLINSILYVNNILHIKNIHIYGVSSVSWFLFPIIKKIFKINVIITVIGTELNISKKKKIFSFINKSAIKYVCGITTVSSSIKKMLIEILAMDPKTISVIHHGLSFKLFSSSDSQRVKEKYGMEYEKIIVSVGRLAPVKGYDVLIRALKILKDGGVDFRMLLVGEGRQRRQLDKLSAQLELTDRITFTGSVPYEEVGDYISAGDIFVISSIYEGLPRALIEATYLGKSVVVTDCGGIPDFLQLFNHGYIVPPNNPQALAVKMEKLLRDDETRTMFEGKALKIRDENIYDWDYAVEQYDGLYKQIFNSE